MKTVVLSAFVFIDFCSCFTNFTTLIYICKTFNIKIHVFTLIFLDSLISSSGSIISATLDTLFLSGLLQPTYLLCYSAFLSNFLPICFGAILTLLLSFIRYILARSSAKNIHPSNKTVVAISIAIFSSISSFVLLTFLVHALLDIPFVYFIDICSNLGFRPKKIFSLFFLQIPNCCNILTLIIDLQMIRFLKKVIIQPQSNILHGLGETFMSFQIRIPYTTSKCIGAYKLLVP